MSAPQTNIEKQKKRHRGPLIGMALLVVVAVPVFLLWLTPDAETDVNTDAVLPAPTETIPPQTAPANP